MAGFRRSRRTNFIFLRIFCFLLSSYLVVEGATAEVDPAVNPGVNSTGNESANATVNHDQLLYQRLLKTKRKEQREVANSLMMLDDYSKQYKVVLKLATKIMEVLNASNTTLNASGYVPGVSRFPNQSQAELREALANVIENIIFFGDMSIRLPDALDEILRVHKSKKWMPLVAWAWDFTNRTGLVAGSDLKLMDLMAQELLLKPRDPNYHNPYRKPKLTPQEWEKLRKDKAKKKKEEERQKKKKGRRKPRLGGGGHTEL